MSIWKQCNLAVSGSGERTNVCLMWARPGHVIALFTRERLRGGWKKNNEKPVIKYSELWFKAGCVLLVRLHLPLFFCFCQFPPFDVYLWVPVSLSYVHTQSHPLPHLCLCCCVWLVSGAKERRAGAPWSPWGQPEAPRISREALNGASRLRSAPLIADFSLPFEICVLTCSMCSYAQTTCRCVSLSVLPSVSGGDTVSWCVYCCTFLGRDYKYTQSQEHVGPPCLCVYVWWLSHNLGCLFNSRRVDAWC